MAPDAGVPDFFQNAELALDPSVSAVIVTVEVLGGALVDEEHPLIARKPNNKRKVETAIVVYVFMLFLKVEIANRRSIHPKTNQLRSYLAELAVFGRVVFSITSQCSIFR
jgi:hypothetical protein